MALPHAEKLIEEAQKGRKLNSTERRFVIAYKLATNPLRETNTDLAELFQVSERTVRDDKNKIRAGVAKEFREEDIGLVFSDVVMNLDRIMRQLEDSTSKTKVGSKERRSHLEAQSKLVADRIKLLQELGHYPKNLGTMQVKKFEYKAEVSLQNQLPARPIDLFDENKALPPTIDAEVVSTNAKENNEGQVSNTNKE